MTDNLSPTHVEQSLIDVQETKNNDTEIQGGSDAFFDAIAQTIFDEQNRETTPENVRELAKALKDTMEFSNPGLISSLNTGDVGGLTAEELNIALSGVFTGPARTEVTKDGIESASSVFENLGIAKDDLSLEAHIAMSGIMTQMHDQMQRSLNFNFGIPEALDPFPSPPNEMPTIPDELDEVIQQKEPTCEELRQILPLGSNKGCFNI